MSEEEKEMILKCTCIDKCGIVEYEYLKDFDNFAISFYQKRRVKGNSIIIDKKQAKELIDFLNKFVEE